MAGLVALDGGDGAGTELAVGGEPLALGVELLLHQPDTAAHAAAPQVTNAILQGLNRMNVPVRNALISLALHVIALYIMLMIFNMGIYSMVFASILFALFMCILNAIAIRNTLGYRQEMVKTFLLPAISAAFMGAAAYGVYRGVTLVIHSNVLGTLLAVLVAVAVYGVLLIKLHCIEEDEMYSMPMGRKLTRICRKLHLM